MFYVGGFSRQVFFGRLPPPRKYPEQKRRGILACNFPSAQKKGNFYRIPADLRDLNYSQYVDEFGHRVDCKQYNSDNTRRLDVEQMKEMLLKLDYVREELAKFKAKA